MIDWNKIKNQQEEALFNVDKRIKIRAIAADIDRILIGDESTYLKVAQCIGVVTRIHQVKIHDLYLGNSKFSIIGTGWHRGISTFNDLVDELNANNEGFTIKVVN